MHVYVNAWAFVALAFLFALLALEQALFALDVHDKTEEFMRDYYAVKGDGDGEE